MEVKLSSQKTVDKRINQLKRSIKIHSYLYYVIDHPIVYDHVWQAWADELAKINKPTGLWDDEFYGWDGTTGYHLKWDEGTISKALSILRLDDKMEGTK